MYQLSIKEEFVAQHFLTVPNCGAENVKHSHVYAIEIQLEGGRLNEHGYLIDIDDAKSSVEHVLGQYRDKTLNETPAFKGLNPSIEHFSRIAADEVKRTMDCSNLDKVTVRIWEDRYCWASYSIEL